MRAFRYVSAAALLVGTLAFGGSQQANAATTNVPGAKYNASTKLLAESASTTVEKSAYSRIWKRGDCQALERVAVPVIVRGGTAEGRARFNQKVRQVIDSDISKIMARGLKQQSEMAAANGTRCGGANALKAYYGKIRSAGSVYADRYVSVVLHTYVNFDSASSCLDSYRTYTYDLKTGEWAKLSRFAKSNHGQLAGTWLAKATHRAAPKVSYFSPLKKWTVSDSGVKFYAASGDLGSCSMGARSATVAWRNVLRPGDSSASARVYKVRTGMTRKYPEGTTRVVVKGRQVKAKVCTERSCEYYYGVRNGRKLTKVWRQGRSGNTKHWTAAGTYFGSKSAQARPVFVATGRF